MVQTIRDEQKQHSDERERKQITSFFITTWTPQSIAAKEINQQINTWHSTLNWRVKGGGSEDVNVNIVPQKIHAVQMFLFTLEFLLWFYLWNTKMTSAVWKLSERRPVENREWKNKRAWWKNLNYKSAWGWLDPSHFRWENKRNWAQTRPVWNFYCHLFLLSEQKVCMGFACILYKMEKTACPLEWDTARVKGGFLSKPPLSQHLPVASACTDSLTVRPWPRRVPG